METAENKNEYIAVVIAAGLSSRMGWFKPIADIGGKAALLRLLDTIEASGLRRALVVTGHNNELIEEALGHRLFSSSNALSCETKYNAGYESGMFSSIQAGIRLAARPAGHVARAALLFPVDVPLVSKETIRGLIKAYEKGSSSSFSVPVYEGKNGHPLLIPRDYFDEILGFTGEGGLKAVRGRYDAEMIRYEVDDEGCVLDMDTPEDYEKLLDYDRKMNNEE